MSVYLHEDKLYQLLVYTFPKYHKLLSEKVCIGIPAIFHNDSHVKVY